MTNARVQLFNGAGSPFELREIALPGTLQPGQVLVEILLATICGSDLHTLQGRRAAPVPCVLGHEAIGRVVSSARANILPGQRITWSLADSCGCCPACTGYRLPQKCVRLFKYGHASAHDGSGLNGCYASHILLRPGTAIFPIPDGLSDAVVAPANCALASVINALAQAPRPFRTALIQGGGLLGLYACAVLSHRGLDKIFCADINDARLALVRDFGGIPINTGAKHADEACRRLVEESGGGVDLVLEVAGSADAVPQGMRVLRPGGFYIWAGMVHPRTSLNLTGEEVVKKCVHIRGVHNYAPEDLDEALKFLVQTHDRLPYGKLVSPPLPLEELNEAMLLAEKREWLRVAVKPGMSRHPADSPRARIYPPT